MLLSIIATLIGHVEMKTWIWKIHIYDLHNGKIQNITEDSMGAHNKNLSNYEFPFCFFIYIIMA
jgi:hypothetical protein